MTPPQYYQAAVKSSHPLVSSFQWISVSLSLHHLSPNFSIIQHSSRGSQAIYPLAVRAPVQVLSSWSCILRAKFPIQSQSPLEPAPALVAGGTAGCVWPQKVDDREREREREREMVFGETLQAGGNHGIGVSG